MKMKLPLALLALCALALPARAGPPTDLDACIKLIGDTVKAAKVDTEVKYVKFHMRLLDLQSACGTRDFAAAQKIADEIMATFPPDK